MAELIIEPLFDNILVLPEEKPKQNAKGIYLPHESGEALTIGEVIAVGEGKYTDNILPNTIASNGGGGSSYPVFIKQPMHIKAGQRIYYKQWATSSIKMNGKEYFLLKQDDVLAIIRNAESSETTS